MRYKLDINGYIDCVLWGCNTGSCQEYTGAVPDGYETLTEWADKAIINAYFIDGEGNLTLDTEREQQIKANIAQETTAYEPVVKKDLFAIEDTISSQYAKETATGKFVIIENAKDVPPMVILSNLQSSAELNIFAHTKNMLPVNIEYVDFGSLTVEYDMLKRMIVDGWASEDLECTIAGSETNTTPLFALLANESYYLNLGGVECEMLYYNGETTEQIYSGGSGVISLSENKRVTQIKLKFPADSIYEEEIYPYLTPGSGRNSDIEGEECKTKILTIPLGSVTADTTLVIKDRMIAKVNGDTSETIAAGSMSLFNGYNLIYTDQGNDIFIEYSTDGMEGSVGGWKIDGNTLYCDIVPPDDYTEEDKTKLQNYIVGATTLTEEEIAKLDITGDGEVNSADLNFINQLVAWNLQKTNPGKLILDTDNWRQPIRLLDSDGNVLSAFGPGGATPNLNGTLPPITLTGSQYYSQGLYGLNLQNSDLIKVNSIYFNDAANGADEGLMFARGDDVWDTFRLYNGKMYITTGSTNGFGLDNWKEGETYDVPYVTEYKATATDVWGYRKWSNGMVECWLKKACSSVLCDSAWGNVYVSDNYDLGNYPVTFSVRPIQVMAIHQTSSAAYELRHPYGDYSNTASHAGYVTFVRPSKQSGAANVYMSVYTIGYL